MQSTSSNMRHTSILIASFFLISTLFTGCKSAPAGLMDLYTAMIQKAPSLKKQQLFDVKTPPPQPVQPAGTFFSDRMPALLPHYEGIFRDRNQGGSRYPPITKLGDFYQPNGRR